MTGKWGICLPGPVVVLSAPTYQGESDGSKKRGKRGSPYTWKLKDFEEALPVIQKFINTNDEFLIRYGYLFLFNYVKDKDNLERIFSLFKNSSYFYVKMVEGRVLSFLYIYSNEETYNYLLNSSLDYEIKNIAIRKICDSYRVNKEDKDKLKLLRKRLKEKITN